MRVVSRSTTRSWRKVMVAVVLMASVISMLVYWLHWNDMALEQASKRYRNLYYMEQFERKTNVELKTILFWNSYFHYPNFGLGDGSGQELFINAKCSTNSCFTTSDRELIPVEDFDAIMFHTYDLNTFPPHYLFFLKNDIPPRRKASQRYIHFLMEPPGNVDSDMKSLNSFFNWTMSYRWDSDIPRPYSWVTPIGSSELTPPNPHPDWLKPHLDFKDSSKLKLVGQKTKLIAWFASNCETFSKREDYVKELSKYIPVDIYGACGTNSCPKSDSGKCYEMLNENYKFYLSLENSLCRDYVTEKLFGIMGYDIIPVVYGAANYSNHVPPMSYINTLDFKSARELAEYLVFLDRNPLQYVKYFWWKQHYKINSDKNSILCKLCEMLHQQHKPKSYSDIHKWWSGSDICLKPSIVQ